MAFSPKLRKELVDQPLHFLWASATFLGPWVALGVKLPCWARYALLGASLLSFLTLVLREIYQHRLQPGGILWHWPWLDFSFYVLGGVAGTVIGRFGL